MKFWATRSTRHPDHEEEKIFCIGRNKTGTTTMARVLDELGYRVAPQRYAELLSDEYYLKNEFSPILRFCLFFNAFQDVPFSWPGTYRVIDREFPNARFILTLRDTPDQWYESLVRFHAKRLGSKGRIPTADELKASDYVRTGFMYRSKRIWRLTDRDLYDRKTLIQSYSDYNDEVKNYFSGRDGKLLVINVGNREDYRRLCRFLGKLPVRKNGFPRENPT